jgi:hypothetical protein
MLFVWVIKMDKKRISHMASLPMEKDASANPFNKLD